jgi:hypothetical protein
MTLLGFLLPQKASGADGGNSRLVSNFQKKNWWRACKTLGDLIPLFYSKYKKTFI